MKACAPIGCTAILERGRGKSYPMSFVRIPVTNHTDVAALQSLLRSARFFLYVEPGFGEASDLVSIRHEDLVRVKAFLRDFRIHNNSGGATPIPW